MNRQKPCSTLFLKKNQFPLIRPSDACFIPPNTIVFCKSVLLSSKIDYMANPDRIRIRKCWVEISTVAVVDCGSLPNPLNGMVELELNTFGSQASYSCMPGYTLQGEEQRTCLSTGEWSGEEPFCQGNRPYSSITTVRAIV